MKIEAHIVLSLIIVYSCSSEPFSIHVDDINNDPSHWVESKGVENALKRAAQLALINWTPLSPVPWNHGVYDPGIQYTGIPYSSTKQINKYVGLDVSFHTFMTAVHNPHSVLYTQNISKDPYNGVNCATYYGTVCSTLVDYAFGFDPPYTANWLVSMPDFEMNIDQSLEYLKPGDLVHMPGHIFMIYRTLKNDDGKVITVSFIEAAGMNCRMQQVSAESFQNRIKQDGYVFFRYKKIDKVAEYVKSEYVPVGAEIGIDVHYNNSLCPERGDRCVYRVDEDIIINVLESKYTDIKIENKTGKNYSYPAEEVSFIGRLPEGMYEARANNDSDTSESISFYVANPQVKVVKNGKLHITFSCNNCLALYCVLCDYKGDFYQFYEISDLERQNGYIDVNLLDKSEYYCKVGFRTPYGIIVNNPVPII